MRLRYLSLCLLSLTIMGCTQHAIKTENTQPLLEQRAVQGLNSLYETSGYDFKGKLSVQTQPITLKRNDPQYQTLNHLSEANKKKIEDLLKQQNIHLNHAEKKAFFDAILSEQNLLNSLSALQGSDSKWSKSVEALLAFMNDLQFNYHGSIDYRAKLAALNLNIKYEKPTLLVNAKIPMVVDFKNYKFYSNYFALMPFMVNKDSQNSYTYIDFSKFKAEFEHINMEKLVDYLKQTNALPYVLAQPQSIQSLSPTANEKAMGTVEKIRLKSDFATLMLQQQLFSYVNSRYLSEQILAQSKTETQKEDDLVVKATVLNEGSTNLSDAAYASSKRIITLLNPVEAEPEQGTNVVTATEQSSCSIQQQSCSDDIVIEDTVSAASSVSLSEAACLALQQHQQSISVGAVTLCRNNYDIDLMASTQQQNAAMAQGYLGAFKDLEPVFKAYQTAELKDVNAFKKIWQDHQVEIAQALKTHIQQPFKLQMDVGLDQKGRLVDATYEFSNSQSPYGNIRVLSQTQFSAYGHASGVDQKALQQAKSVEEVTKGSILEKLLQPVVKDLGQIGLDVQQQEAYDAQLNKIALQTYQKTGSYLKTYQVVYSMLYAVRRPTELNYFSAKTIREIAELSAYHFNPDLPQPKGIQAQRLEKLAIQHGLIDDEAFDSVGLMAAEVVDDVIAQTQKKQDIQRNIQHYKTAQAAFAAQYTQLFTDEYELSIEQQQQLTQVAKILAQAFSDDLKGQLTLQSVQGFQPEYDDLVDKDIYAQAYMNVQQYWKK